MVRIHSGVPNSFIISYLHHIDFLLLPLTFCFGGKGSMLKSAAFHAVSINLPLKLPQQFPPQFHLFWPLRPPILSSLAERFAVYPTDSNLPGDGVRVLIRDMKRIGEIVGQQEAKLQARSRSVKFRILEIGRVVRTKGGPNRERLEPVAARSRRRRHSRRCNVNGVGADKN